LHLKDEKTSQASKFQDQFFEIMMKIVVDDKQKNEIGNTKVLDVFSRLI